MTKNHPLCPVCHELMERNGFTSKGTQRWRCKSTTCGASTTKQRRDKRLAADFKRFITHVTGQQSMDTIACAVGISRRCLSTRFRTFWYIPTPDPVDPHRIFEQLFIDGTHLSAGCLLIASTKNHIVNWVWAKEETTHDYIRLVKPIPEPIMVCLDGGRGAYSAIKKAWPSTRIQRCLVHAHASYAAMSLHDHSPTPDKTSTDSHATSPESPTWTKQLNGQHNCTTSTWYTRTTSTKRPCRSSPGKENSLTFECVKPITASKISTVNNDYLPTSIRPITPRIQISNGHRLPTAWKADLTPHSNNTPDSTEEEAVNDDAKPSTGGYTCEYISRKTHKK